MTVGNRAKSKSGKRIGKIPGGWRTNTIMITKIVPKGSDAGSHPEVL
jgi:hypothetical protein